jgi:hypothetical protein
MIFFIKFATLVLVVLFVNLAAVAADNCRGKFALSVDLDQSIQARAIAYEVQQSAMQQHLEFLTGKKPMYYHHKLADRYSSGNRELTRLYLIGALQKLGLTVKLELFPRGANFYAEIPGTTKSSEVFEVAAHYDTAGSGNPGADDNGSGIAILLEMARIFTLNPPGRTLRLTFLDLEEVGMVGSQAHAEALAKEFSRLGSRDDGARSFMGSLIVDMVGYSPSGRDQKQKLVIEVGRERNFSATTSAWSRTDAYQYNLACASVVCDQFLRFASGRERREGQLLLTVAQETALPHTGDHGSYWQQGIPALFLGTPYEYPYINPGNHSERDTVEKINWEFFLAATELAVEMTAAMTQANSSMGQEAVEAAALEVNPDLANYEGSASNNVDLLTVKPPAPKSFEREDKYDWDNSDPWYIDWLPDWMK